MFREFYVREKSGKIRSENNKIILWDMSNSHKIMVVSIVLLKINSTLGETCSLLVNIGDRHNISNTCISVVYNAVLCNLI